MAEDKKSNALAKRDVASGIKPGFSDKDTSGGVLANVPAGTSAVAPSFASAIALIQKNLNTEKLSKETLAELRRALNEYPNLWRVAGDLALQARERMIDRAVKQPVAREMLSAGLKAMEDELGREGAPMMEKLLIDQIIVCWLNMYTVQQYYENNMAGSLSLAQADYWERRLTSVQRRYLKAIETLAKVRKMARPNAIIPMQVNIGTGGQLNQLNMPDGELPPSG